MKRKRTTKRNDRGSALLVSLMVMVGLSLLGLAFVAVSETESAISVNERNYTQTLQVAEAGLRTAAEWFNAPQWASENGLVPANTAAIKQERRNATYQGFYKSVSASSLLFDRPYGNDDGRFMGANAASADLVIDYTTDATFMDRLNQRLFNDNNEGGRIIEIRVYGPPVVAGTTTTFNGRQYWNNSVGTRYGLATIAVTAEKTRDGTRTGQVVARRTMRAVVAELPMPGADGPLQSHSGTGTTGNFRIHWGKAISNGSMAVKRLHTSLPWRNAWDIIPYEQGYADVSWPATPKYLFELIGKGFEDPWFEVRARGDATPPAGSPATSGTNQLWLYTSENNAENAVGTSGYSAHFRFQNEDNKPINKKVVLFSRPVYDVWKQIALAGAGQQGIYYLRYVSGSGFDSRWRDVRGEVREWRDWVNIHRGGEEGFFFFDTTTGANPQLPNGNTNTAILVNAGMSITSSAGNPFKMRGFFYMNMTSWGTSGLNDPGTYYNMPGEPFRDIGLHQVDKNTGQLLCSQSPPPTPLPCLASPGTGPDWINFTNKQWDYQDLNNNGRFDYKVAQNSALIVTPGTDTPDIAANSEYFIVPYTDGCGSAIAGGWDVTTGAVTCSEPHEPYLNLIYPNPTAIGGTGCPGSDPCPSVVRWHADNLGSTVRRPKKMSGGSPVNCTAASTPGDCTSNAYDDTGAVVTLGGDGAILEGVIYNEGNYDAAGNATYYGAVLVQGTVTGSGSPIVFFDESLKTGKWQDKFRNLPRTIMTSIETDQ